MILGNSGTPVHSVNFPSIELPACAMLKMDEHIKLMEIFIPENGIHLQRGLRMLRKILGFHAYKSWSM